MKEIGRPRSFAPARFSQTMTLKNLLTSKISNKFAMKVKISECVSIELAAWKPRGGLEFKNQNLSQVFGRNSKPTLNIGKECG